MLFIRKIVKKFTENSLLKNSSIYIGLAFLQKSISFLLVPFYTAFLPPSEFGIVNQVVALGSIYILVLTYALDEAAARFYFKYKNEKKRKEEAIGSITILSSIFVIFGAGLLFGLRRYSYYEFVPDIPANFILLSILIIVSSPIYFIYQKILRIREDSKLYSFLMLGYSFTQILLSIFFIVVLELSALGYILALSITSVVFGVFCLFKIKKNIRFKLSKEFVYDALKYSSSIVPHTISSWGLRGYTIVSIGMILSASAVGIFNAINFLAIIINVLTKAILDAYQPWVYRKLESGDENSIKDILFVARVFGIVFIGIGFFLSLFSPEIISLLIDSQYHSGIRIAPVLIFSSIFLALGSVMVFILYYKQEKTKYIGFATITGSVINIVACIFLIPNFGILGAALSLAFANLVISILKQVFASQAISSNALLLDNYLLAIINLIISYYVIKLEVSVIIKLILFLIECVIIYLFYKKILHSVKNIFLKG